MKLPVITSLIHYSKVFYGYAGKKLFVLVSVISLSSIFDGLGISILIPIFDIANQESSQNVFTQNVYMFLELIGLEVSIPSLLLLLVAIFSLKGFFLFSQDFITALITTNLNKSLRIEFCKKYADLNYEFFTNTNVGYLNNIITTEINRAIQALRNYIHIVILIAFIMVFVGASLIINWKITLLTVAISSIIFLMLRSLSRKSNRLSILESKTNAQIQSLLLQCLYNFKYLKATDRFNSLFRPLFRIIDKNRYCTFKRFVYLAVPNAIREPLAAYLLSGLILYYVFFMGKVMGEVFVVLIFFYRTFTNIMKFPSIWQKFNGSVGGINVVKEASENIHNNMEHLGSIKIKSFRKNIEFKNVAFAYNNKQVLSNINIVIPKNKAIGIVGESGAGKTTIFDLITGLLKANEGDIFIDSINYKELDISSLRTLVGYVTQEPVMFNDTIGNNISFWDSNDQNETGKDKIKTAAEYANCDSFVADMEECYETIMGDQGVRSSGGQRQRIAIAREIYKEPEILIFDEATSSLDSESEIKIQESILKMIGKRTLLIISHRLSTVKNCDYIYVLKNGEIAEEGTFGDLYNGETLFNEMCRAQKLSNYI